LLPLSLSAQSYSEVLAASAPADWRELDAENTLYLTLASGTVIIELAPLYAPNHVANIKALAVEGYYNGLAIVRSQDNYVVQWADPNADKPDAKPVQNAKRNLAAEYTVKYNESFAFTVLADHDGYAPQVGHSNGFAVGRDPQAQTSWLTHCYGAVGVSRGVADNSGDGTSLYVVTGHAPRHLDRNITVVGRVIQGMELLSTLPRGSGSLGFYTTSEAQIPIERIQLATAVPAEQRLKLEVLRTDSATFNQAVASLRNRGGDWYKRPAGYIELCNVWVPSRVKN
jgi:cyclophilin family peptidyl-prolyl cis-trans isomerase